MRKEDEILLEKYKKYHWLDGTYEELKTFFCQKAKYIEEKNNYTELIISYETVYTGIKGEFVRKHLPIGGLHNIARELQNGLETVS